MTTTITKPDWRVPDGRLILRADAPQDEWLSKRTGYLGGSDMAVITGGARYKNTNPYTIWCDKTSDVPPVEEDNDLFWFGHAVEPLLAAKFEELTGIQTRACGMYESKLWSFLAANPDRLTADGGILEEKTTTRYTDNGKLYLAGIVPHAHRIQVVTYMLVTGRRIGHVIALVDRTPVVLRVEWDQDLADAIIRDGHAFWQHVTDRTPPPVDPTTATEDELASRFPAETVDPDSAVEAPIPEAALDDVATLAALKADAKSNAEAIKAVETRLKALTGDKEYLTVNGHPIVRWQTIAGKRSFDADAVLRKIAADRGVEPTKAVLAEIKAEYTKQGAPTRRLTLIEQEVAA